MARKLSVVALVAFLGIAAMAAGTSAVLPGLTVADLLEAWPATERFTDGLLERVVAYPAALHGRATARRDIAEGRLALKMWGLPASWRFIYSEILASRGITSKIVAGCVVSQPQLASWEGYNDVMVAEVERRYGKDFLDATADQAGTEFERRKVKRELPWQRAAAAR